MACFGARSGGRPAWPAVRSQGLYEVPEPSSVGFRLRVVTNACSCEEVGAARAGIADLVGIVSRLLHTVVWRRRGSSSKFGTLGADVLHDFRRDPPPELRADPKRPIVSTSNANLCTLSPRRSPKDRLQTRQTQNTNNRAHTHTFSKLMPDAQTYGCAAYLAAVKPDAILGYNEPPKGGGGGGHAH